MEFLGSDLLQGGKSAFDGMDPATYDPTAKAADAFAMGNMVEGADAKIMTAAERAKLANDDKTTTATVGASVAAAAIQGAVDDAQVVAGVLTGSSTLVRWTWGTVKAWIKAWISKADVGLGNVDNTSDASKVASGPIKTALDGKQASLGYTPVQQGTGVGQNVNAVKIGWSNPASQLLLTIDATDFGAAWPISISGSADALNGKADTAFATAAQGTKADNAVQPADLEEIGVGQTWQSVGRSLATAYQNTTGRPIMVSSRVTTAGAAQDFQVSANGTTWVSVVSILPSSVGYAQVIIPTGHYYKWSASSQVTLDKWLELR